MNQPNLAVHGKTDNERSMYLSAIFFCSPLRTYRDPANIRRMDTAVRLNELIVEHSHNAQLVMVNLPGPPDKAGGNEEQNCIPDSCKKRGSGYCATSYAPSLLVTSICT